VNGVYEDLLLVGWTVLKIVVIMLPLIIAVAYLTYAERRIIGSMQGRLGPNRVGPWGLVQPFADVFKLLLKEIVLPTNANRFLFLIAPLLALGPAFAAWAVIPFDDGVALTNVNASLLYILALTSLAVYGVIIAGWSSNSKYAFLGAMRAAAQIVSYEISMGFALVAVVIAAGSLNLQDIIAGQTGPYGALNWYALPLLPILVIYFISGVAETNRAPFDVAEGESEIVAGFHVEYSGAAFAVFFLAEYANMILIAALASVLFLGGWLSPVPESVQASTADVFFVGWALGNGWHWFFSKIFFFLWFYLWFRATFPRYRYDQIMRLGWKVFIPITIVWLLVVAWWSIIGFGPWWEVSEVVAQS